MFRQVAIGSGPFVAVVLLLAIALGVLYSRQLVRPIEELTEATSRIAGGDWNVPRMHRPPNEIGRLVESFTLMGDELAKREKALNKANSALVRSERLAVLGQFSAGIAHEVKNPLNSILGFAQLLQQKTSSLGDETISKYLNFLMDETRRASRIISDLLTFARQKPPVVVPVPVRELLDRAGELFQPQAATSKIELVKEIADPAITALLDRDQMIQVLTNLIQNAIHILEEKPDGQLRRIVLKLSRAGDWALIEVTDNGGGIAPENLSRLFEPFFSTKKAGKGTGLGLSMCHGIVTQHQGQIDVSSSPDQGTTFSIRLPTASA